MLLLLLLLFLLLFFVLFLSRIWIFVGLDVQQAYAAYLTWRPHYRSRCERQLCFSWTTYFDCNIFFCAVLPFILTWPLFSWSTRLKWMKTGLSLPGVISNLACRLNYVRCLNFVYYLCLNYIFLCFFVFLFLLRLFAGLKLGLWDFEYCHRVFLYKIMICLINFHSSRVESRGCPGSARSALCALSARLFSNHRTSAVCCLCLSFFFFIYYEYGKLLRIVAYKFREMGLINQAVSLFEKVNLFFFFFFILEFVWIYV